MNGENYDYHAIASRAKRRFPDYKLDMLFPVCLPVYELRIKVTEMVGHSLSTTALFVLQLTNLDIRRPSEICRMLGLTEEYLATATAELLSEGLVIQLPDLDIKVTDIGKEVIRNGGKSLRTRSRYPKVPYDHLSKRIITFDLDHLRDGNDVRKDGLFVVPAKPRRPHLGNLRITEVREYDRIYTHKRSQPAEILEISEVKDVRLRYRDDVVLVRLNTPNYDNPLFAAYSSAQYLEEESGAIQRLADSGVNLVPDEHELTDQTSAGGLPLILNEEPSLIEDIERLYGNATVKKQTIAEIRSEQGTTQNEQERNRLESRIAEVEREKSALEEMLVERENKLKKLTSDQVRLIKTEDHRGLLLKAIDRARSEITLVSAWVNDRAFDDEVRKRLLNAINRGTTVRIAWGLGAKRGSDAQRNRAQGNSALSKLRKVIPSNRKQQLIERREETHEKFIICDELFCAWGSFNWLSYRGDMDVGYRRETSYYSERSSDIELWKERAISLFKA